jgi:hypothetical protein
MAPQFTATKGRWRRGEIVDGAGGNFLAGAGLAEDQYGGVMVCNLPDEADDVANGVRGAGWQACA